MAKPLLPDELWERIQPLLPPRPKPKRPDRPGRPPLEDRKALTGILFVLKTGIDWEDLPQELGCGCGVPRWRGPRECTKPVLRPRLPEPLLAELHGADKSDWRRALI